MAAMLVSLRRKLLIGCTLRLAFQVISAAVDLMYCPLAVLSPV